METLLSISQWLGLFLILLLAAFGLFTLVHAAFEQGESWGPEAPDRSGP